MHHPNLLQNSHTNIKIHLFLSTFCRLVMILTIYKMTFVHISLFIINNQETFQTTSYNFIILLIEKRAKSCVINLNAYLENVISSQYRINKYGYQRHDAIYNTLTNRLVYCSSQCVWYK